MSFTLSGTWTRRARRCPVRTVRPCMQNQKEAPHYRPQHSWASESFRNPVPAPSAFPTGPSRGLELLVGPTRPSMVTSPTPSSRPLFLQKCQQTALEYLLFSAEKQCWELFFSRCGFPASEQRGCVGDPTQISASCAVVSKRSTKGNTQPRERF